MKRHVHLRDVLVVCFLSVICFLALGLSVLNFYVIRRYILDRAQEEVNNNLKTARMAYDEQGARIRFALEIVQPREEGASLFRIRDRLGLDYLRLIGKEEAETAESLIVREAVRVGRPMAGTRIIEEAELVKIGRDVYRKSAIPVRYTPRARATEKTRLTSAMSIEYARPVFSEKGDVERVLFGGRVLNRNHEIVDNIRDAVFERKFYDSKPMGTVTIFQDDVRVATNVVDGEGERAVGTRVSEEVYEQVVENGRQWFARAFVVTDWYITAYEPIRNIEGAVIGILYVGILEKPFNDMRRNIFLAFLGITAAVSLIAVALSCVLATFLTRPLMELLQKTRHMSEGQLESKVEARTPVTELNELAVSFNEMGGKLAAREKSLDDSNKKLAALNKNYLDLVGFVSHELKGMIASAILNVHSVKGGFLGAVNERQKTLLDSVGRNLEQLSFTIRNFLDLSRFEKGELHLDRRDILLKKDIVDESLEVFKEQIAEKGLKIENAVPEHVSVNADGELLKIVANNLIRNAVKYGRAGGKVRISAVEDLDCCRVEIYNDGEPIPASAQGQLFRKFSRLAAPPEKKKIKGTGLGLFITKQIVEKHGGRIWVEAGRDGNTFVFTVAKKRHPEERPKERRADQVTHRDT